MAAERGGGHLLPNVGQLQFRDKQGSPMKYYVLLCMTAPCPEERDRQYFGRNFDKFRQLFIMFGMTHPDNPCD